MINESGQKLEIDMTGQQKKVNMGTKKVSREMRGITGFNDFGNFNPLLLFKVLSPLPGHYGEEKLRSKAFSLLSLNFDLFYNLCGSLKKKDLHISVVQHFELLVRSCISAISE